ncbi:MAG: nuclear transport factor 2 family protein [Acidobacteria bacterium]|nr:nuclear transport factor 2 family protein [Acidobacteriota bacterium]MCA1638814.1 nuclear transport factor 2 family protein [Acidobacteriota bacterium]
MRFQNIIFIAILVFSISAVGCSTTETPTNTTTKTTNTNAAAVNADNPLTTQKTPEETTTNKAETIAPVVQAYCAAMRKKDDAALRKIYSQAALKSLEADMKEEKQTSLAEYLSTEPVGEKPCEVRNEKIEGEKAIAEVRTETYPNGVKMYFVKENGGWKMTNESPEFQSVRQSATNSNTGK